MGEALKKSKLNVPKKIRYEKTKGPTKLDVKNFFDSIEVFIKNLRNPFLTRIQIANQLDLK